MSKTTYNLEITKDNKVTCHGVDFGGEMTVVARNREFVVVKVAAHTYSRGILADRGYSSPETKVYKILSESNYSTYDAVKVEQAISWESKRKAKATA